MTFHMHLHKTPSDVCTLKKKDQVLKMPQNVLLIKQDIGLWGSRSITRAYLIRFLVTSLLKFTDCNCSMKSPSKAFFFCLLESLKRHLHALQSCSMVPWSVDSRSSCLFSLSFIFFLTVYNNFLSAPTPPPEVSYFSSLFTAVVLFTSLEGGTSQWVTVMSLSCGFLLM